MGLAREKCWKLAEAAIDVTAQRFQLQAAVEKLKAGDDDGVIIN